MHCALRTAMKASFCAAFIVGPNAPSAGSQRAACSSRQPQSAPSAAAAWLGTTFAASAVLGANWSWLQQRSSVFTIGFGSPSQVGTESATTIHLRQLRRTRAVPSTMCAATWWLSRAITSPATVRAISLHSWRWLRSGRPAAILTWLRRGVILHRHRWPSSSREGRGHDLAKLLTFSIASKPRAGPCARFHLEIASSP